MNTSLTPFKSPFGLSRDLRSEFDTMLKRFFDGGNGMELAGWNPEVNISETDKQFEVKVDLPGMKPDDFNVELRHGDLWISGERSEEKEEKDKTWHRIERRSGQFRRILTLGQEVDAENVEAEYKDGVLHVIVPKMAVAQPKKVQVKKT